MSLAVCGFAPTVPPAGLRLTPEDNRVHKQKASERFRKNLILETDRQQKAKAARKRREASGVRCKQDKGERAARGARAERQSPAAKTYKKRKALNILEYLKIKVLGRRHKKQNRKSNEV
jgi:hypothetical protein